MNVQYIEPLSRGYGRMKQALFQPFNMKKWFVVGFTAWLAGLLDGGGSSGGNSSSNIDGDFGDVLDAPNKAWMWVQDNPQWTIAIIFGIVFLFFFIAVLTWLSSRGKFMFVDNVVHDRALIAQPWHEYSKEGDSLFVWRFIYSLVCIAAVVGFLYQAWQSLYLLYFGSYDGSIPWPFLIKTIFLFVLLMMALGYIDLLINEFIVAIMYKHRVTASQAWQRLLAIHWQHFAKFLLFAILWSVMVIAVVILVIIGGLVTCCIGFILLLLPYINAVVTLPISYTFRGFSLEFLAQFGDEYSVFSDQTDSGQSVAVG
jgi:hypothetical protein